MTLNVRTFAVSMLTGGLIALGSSVAMAQTVNNVDNTTSGESGHGAGCSNFVGGCSSTQESSTSGTYQTTSGSGSGQTTNTNSNLDNTTPSANTPYVGCMPASDATPGHCMTGGTNK